MRRTIEQKAGKGSYLTLNQLEEFVKAARSAGATGREVVNARVSFGGKLQQTTINIDTKE
jgi:hypothetical protein